MPQPHYNSLKTKSEHEAQDKIRWAGTWTGIWRLISCTTQVEIYILHTKWPSSVRHRGAAFAFGDIYGFYLHHFSILAAFDVTVRVFGGAPCVECHVTHKVGWCLAKQRRSDIKVSLLGRNHSGSTSLDCRYSAERCYYSSLNRGL